MIISKAKYKELEWAKEGLELSVQSLKEVLARRDATIAELKKQLVDCESALKAERAEKLEDYSNYFGDLASWQEDNGKLAAQLEEARAKVKDREARCKRLDATLGKVQDERDEAEAKARQAQEALEGAIADTTYWRHQFESTNKRAQELNSQLAEKIATIKELEAALQKAQGESCGLQSELVEKGYQLNAAEAEAYRAQLTSRLTEKDLEQVRESVKLVFEVWNRLTQGELPGCGKTG